MSLSSSSPEAGCDAGARWWPAELSLPVEGPAFSALHRLLATAMMAVLLTLAWRVGPEVLAAYDRQWAAAWFVLAMVGTGVCLGYAGVMLGRTRVTAETIEQHRPFRRVIRLDQITQAKLVYVPRLAWLITPRLSLRSRAGGGAAVFRTADRSVLKALVAIALAAASGRFAQAREQRNAE